MSMHFSDIARQAAADGSITSGEILALRRDGWGDGKIDAEEAEAIFALNEALSERPAEWCDFFVDSIGEYVLNTWQPHGYVTDEQAARLIGKVAADGTLDSMVELELLVRVLERAQNVPEVLKEFSLDQVERAVLTGRGPTRDGGSLDAGCVSAGECHVLRRVIFSAGGDRPAAVSRGEAERLFRIKDASLQANNSPEWKTLFVQAVGNYLMGYAALSAQLSRERAAELEAFMADDSSSVGRFLGRMAAGVPSGFGAVFGRKAGPSREEAVAEAQRVTDDEKAWLDAEIGKDGKVDAYERALLAFIAQELAAR